MFAQSTTPAHSGGLWKALERTVAKAVAAVGAALLAVLIVLLFAGVVARYLLHAPLIWSDELCSILFLWLAMFGSALATHHASHMRMTVLVDKFGTQWSTFLHAFALAAGLAFLGLLFWPAWHYAREEAFITTPALEISSSWRAAALPIGIGLMIFFSVGRLVESVRDRSGYLAVVVACCALLAFWTAGPLLQRSGNLSLVIFFIGVVSVCVFAGVPIAFSFGLATFGYLALATRVPMLTLVGRIDEGMSHLMLLAVPTFIFLGVLLEMTGMARAMVQFLASLLGHVRGGLSYVLIGAMYLVSGISGSKAADMAAVAPALIPEMAKRGAKEGDLVALLSATGAQTETIPPSIVLITIGSVVGVSIASLFTGGLMPAAVLGAALCLVVAIRHRKEDTSAIERMSPRAVGTLFTIALPALALPFVIRAAVVEGIATATEVSTIGIAYSICVGLLVYRRFEMRKLGQMLIDTVTLSGAILIIIGAASGMAWALTQSGFSRELGEAMRALPGGSHSFLAVSVIAFIVLGSLLEGIPAVVLFGPLLFPIARTFGIHDVHYAMVVVLAMGIGLFSPPFGVGYYTACAIAKINPVAGLRYIWGYMLALLVGLALVTAFPWLSTGFLKDKPVSYQSSSTR